MNRLGGLFASRIGRRLLKHVGSFGLGMLLLASLVQFSLEYRQATAETEEVFQNVAEVHKNGVIGALWVFDMPQLAAVVDGLSHFPYVSYVGVYDKDKILLERGLRDDDVLSRVVDLSKEHNGQEVFLGSLHLEASKSGILRRVLERSLQSMLAYGLIFGVTALFMLGVFNALVNRHLKLMSDEFRSFNIIDLERPLKLDKPDRNDEIDSLARSFNKLRVNLQMTYQQIILAQEEIKSSERRYRTMIETANDGILILDSELRISFVNRIMAGLLGLDEEDLLGKSAAQVLGLEAGLPIGAGQGKSGLKNDGRQECRLRKADGREIWVIASFTGLNDEYGRRTGSFAMFSDITARKQAELTLQQSEEKFRTVADFTYDWEYWRAPDGSLIWVSPSCREITGYASWEFKSDPRLMEMIVHPEDLSLYQGHVHDVDSGGSHPCDLDFRILRRDGQVVWLNHHCLAIFREDGAPLGRRASNRDITERKRMELDLVTATHEAKSASKAKNEFLAATSHELRTPLNGIMGMLQLLRDSGLDAIQEEFVYVSLESARKLLTILNDILDIARIESDKVYLCSEPVELTRLLNSVADIFRTEARKSGNELSVEIDPRTPAVVITDEVRLRQILFNLIGNAVKFTKEGKIGIYLCPLAALPGGEDVRLLCRVSDTGPGIEPEMVSHVFNSFTQLDAGLSRKFGGLGLGLSIVRKFVELLGGSICVDSQPGDGSAFYFTLEAGLPRPGALVKEGEESYVELKNIPASYRILLAEDDKVNQLTIGRFLEKLGHQPVLASDGFQVLAVLDKSPCDLVLMDIQMPGLDGIEATRLLREKGGKFASLPIVALTAHAMKGDREKFMDSGMDDYIAKPVEMEELKQVIERVMSRGMS